MSHHDVMVLGAGLAGLSAARDLVAGGADTVVLEARDRVGGRVEQTQLADGRVIQLGGEVVGAAHTAYIALAEELELSFVPSYVGEPGEITRQLPDRVDVGDWPGWFDDADKASYDRVEHAFGALIAAIDPADPWSFPDLVALDNTSVGDWLRATGATPHVLLLKEIGQLSLADGSIERTSMFAYSRKIAVGGGSGSYDVGIWEDRRVAEGSATVAHRMAEQLGDRVRLATPVTVLEVTPTRCTVTTDTGEIITASAVVSAMPVGPLRDVQIKGVSGERLLSLQRQRHAWAGKFVAAYASPFWRESGQNGLSECDGGRGVLGSTWPQSDGVLSCLIPPERYAAFAASDESTRHDEALQQIGSLFGAQGLDPVASWCRLWGSDRWTQGYVTNWRPGDVAAVGPLHATHEPPFYVCGSDQWVAGYMEGAVRTGRAAAQEALTRG